jgi:pyruvate dehydrogenase E2 component (dihydrolipoamide acetyltransferase)
MSTIEALTVPKWGLSMEEGTIGQWLINEGDTFSKGDELVEIETSKIVNVLEAPADGTLRRKVVQDGATLPVGALLGIAADPSVADAEIDAFIASFDDGAAAADDSADSSAPVDAAVQSDAPAAPAQQAPVASGGTSVPEALLQGDDDSACLATPHARRFADAVGVNLNNVSGSGREGRISRDDVVTAIVSAGGKVAAPAAVEIDRRAPRSEADDSHIAATPVARRLAKEFGINLYDCRSSGTRGRICKADVEAANALLNGAPATAAAIATGAISAEQAQPEFEEQPMTGMRRTIAARLQQSKQTAPHFRVCLDVKLDNLLSLRKQINAANPAVNISVNDFVIKASAMALVKSPAVNVQYDESTQTVRSFKNADISVAVAIDNGLITPIVKNANSKSLSDISADMRSLATKAKAGTLKPEEFQGGSFSMSNLGMYGVKQFDAIINPPQGAILAVGGGEQRAVVEQGELTVATVMTLSMASDHRVIDGAVAAQFLQLLQQFIENPSLMLA